MDRTDDDVTNELYMRREEAFYVPHDQAWLGDWTPERARCHDNVDRWVAGNPGHKAVRGWLILDISGGEGASFYFNAHSVVEIEDGKLIDITPSEPPCPFLRHLGTDESFERYKKTVPRLQYPPLSQIISSR